MSQRTKGIVQVISENAELGIPIPQYHTYTKMDIADRRREEIMSDVLEEIAHIKNLGYQDFKIKFTNVKNPKEFIIVDNNIKYMDYDGNLYISGVVFFHKEDQNDDTYGRHLLPTHILGNDSKPGADDGIGDYVSYIMDFMFIMMMSHVVENFEGDLDSSKLTDAQLIDLATDVSPNYIIEFSAEEDIINSNPITVNMQNTNDRIKATLSDYIYSYFLEAMDRISGIDHTKGVTFAGIEFDKAILYLCKLIVNEAPPMITVSFAYYIPVEYRPKFDGAECVHGGFFLSRIATGYIDKDSNPIAYAMDDMMDRTAGTKLQLVSDILKMRKLIETIGEGILKSVITAFNSNANGMDEIMESDVFIEIKYAEQFDRVKDVESVCKRTPAQIEEEYRKENPNYDKRKLSN